MKRNDTPASAKADRSGSHFSLFTRNPGRAPSYPPIAPEHLERLESTLTNLDALIRAEYRSEIEAAPSPVAPAEPTLPLPKTHIIIHLPKTGACACWSLPRATEF